MAASRPTRIRKGINYAKLNSKGRHPPEEVGTLEEGQIADSPLRLHPEDDLSTDPRSADVVSVADSRFKEGDVGETSELDYIDDVQDGSSDTGTSVQEVSSRIAEQSTNWGEDEVWQQQEYIMAANWEKMDRLHKRLKRQCRFEQAKLKEEEEKAELACMELEIQQIKQKRSVRSIGASRTVKFNNTENLQIIGAKKPSIFSRKVTS